jgi:phosphohistidine phosphatase
MKYLTVIRHAKSSWDHPGLADHDRPLNERGHKAALGVGKFLHSTYFGAGETPALLPKPDRMISSTAARALATAQHLREEFNLPTEQLLLESRLYLASSQQILDVVQGFDESWNHAFVFGHNPGMHEFAERILARAHVTKMPTCTTIIMALPVAYWALAEWGEAQMIGYIMPKTLERRFPELYAGISRADGED